jgi:hypothetical protein
VNRALARRLVWTIVVLAVVAVLAAGLRIVGSPAAQRIRRLDERRVGDLQAVAYAVDAYWKQTKRLPQSLDELTPSPRVAIQTRDPVSKAPYVYRALTADTYELCAEFEGDAKTGTPTTFWSHPAGRHCFRLTAGITS